MLFARKRSYGDFDNKSFFGLFERWDRLFTAILPHQSFKYFYFKIIVFNDFGDARTGHTAIVYGGLFGIYFSFVKSREVDMRVTLHTVQLIPFAGAVEIKVSVLFDKVQKHAIRVFLAFESKAHDHATFEYFVDDLGIDYFSVSATHMLLPLSSGLEMLLTNKRRNIYPYYAGCAAPHGGGLITAAGIFFHKGFQRGNFLLFITEHFGNSCAAKASVINSRLYPVHTQILDSREMHMRVAGNAFKLLTFQSAVKINSPIKFNETQRNRVGVFAIIESNGDDFAGTEHFVEIFRIDHFSIFTPHDCLHNFRKNTIAAHGLQEVGKRE